MHNSEQTQEQMAELADERKLLLLTAKLVADVAFWTTSGRRNEASELLELVKRVEAEWNLRTPNKERAVTDNTDEALRADAERYRWLRIRGAAFDGDYRRFLEQGLVYRVGNLDAAVDTEMLAAAIPITSKEQEKDHA